MTDPATLDAETLLAIPTDAPERLFSFDATERKRQYRALVRRWHPDANPASHADEVLRHVNLLHAAAGERPAGNARRAPGVLDLPTRDGTRVRLTYRHADTDDLGEIYVARTAAAWLAAPGNADLLDAAADRLERLTFADESMRAEMRRFLPAVRRRFDTPDRAGLVLSMRADLVRLSDLLTHQGGQLDPRHTGWIVSGALNLACYLQWAGLTHNAILPENLFVGLHDHAVALIGGWSYAAPDGAQIKALPAAAHRLAPPDLLTARAADRRLDLELIKHTGRTLLGDPAGTRLAASPDLPEPLVTWLRLPAGRDAVTAYRDWHRALERAFGRRRFATCPVTPDDVYPQT